MLENDNNIIKEKNEKRCTQNMTNAHTERSIGILNHKEMETQS